MELDILSSMKEITPVTTNKSAIPTEASRPLRVQDSATPRSVMLSMGCMKYDNLCLRSWRLPFTDHRQPSCDFHDSAMGSTPDALYHTPDSQQGTPLLTNFAQPAGDIKNESRNEQRAFGQKSLSLEAVIPTPQETDGPKHKLLPRSRNGCW